MQNYPGIPQNTMPLPPVYYPTGGVNYPAGNYPQYLAAAPFPNAGAGYGLINGLMNRIKRQAKSSDSQNKGPKKSNRKSKNKIVDNDSEAKEHWGVHRMLSTGSLV